MSRKKQPDEFEGLAQRFLEAEGYRDIKYEPKGDDKFLDFSIEGSIAVEVTSIASEFLKKTSIWDSLGNILKDVNSKILDRNKNKSYYRNKNKSYYVCINFQGGEEKIQQKHKDSINEYLLQISKEEIAKEHHFQTPEFQISLKPASFCPDRMFMFGLLKFGDEYEPVLEVVIDEVVSRMEKKAKKMEAMTGKDYKDYKEYWLILVASREFAIKLSVLSKPEKEFVYKALNSARPKEWDRVIIITESHADATMAVKIVDIPGEEALPVK